MYTVIEYTKKDPIIASVDTGEIIKPMFEHYSKPEDYIKDNVRFIEPMTAKEYLNDEELELMLTSTDYIAEEKLDGTRCTMHLGKVNRLFSRRISKKTNWFAENTDSVPHLRDLVVTPFDYYDTVIDGEMRIDTADFKEVSSTLNCKWGEAIIRQLNLGFITLHAFDIIYYKGVYVAKLPLIRRKELLKEVVKALESQYVHEEKYTDDLMFVRFTPTIVDLMNSDETAFRNTYPNLYGCLHFQYSSTEFWTKGVHEEIALPKKAWYEYVILHGGEGIMLKHKNGTYKHTRGREYTKYKKFNTWDVVILDFIKPTKEYTGKFPTPKEWNYWEDYTGDLYDTSNPGALNYVTNCIDECIPVTKHYFEGNIGTVKYGVLINDSELIKWQKTNPKEKPEVIDLDDSHYLVVGECSGFDDDTREYMTTHRRELIGTVIEVGANDILKTGKLRHPRFMHFRNDKEADTCIWNDHIRK